MGRITGVRGDTVIRQPSFVSGTDDPPPEEFEQVAQWRIVREIQALADKTFDESRQVDEYRYITGNITTLEILPDYEVDELIEAIVIVANPYQNTGASSVTTVGTTAANPAAGTTVTSQALAAGSYTVGWTAQLGGTTVAADTNNFGLYLGATLLATSLNGIVSGTPYPQPTSIVVVPSGGATLAIKNIAQPGGVSDTYTGQLTTSVLLTPNVVSVQLGDRYFNVTMPPAGVWAQDGLRLRLSRRDRRIVTQPTAGPLALNLTGHADMS